MRETRRRFATITLYKDTRFDETYKHCVRWNSKDDLDNYLNTCEHIEMKGAYQNIMRQIHWDSKIATFNELLAYTYVRIENIDQFNGKSERFYGFITGMDYVNDGTTWISFSLDMWNTYETSVDFGRAMIAQGFVKEVNNDLSDWTEEFNDVRHNSESIGGDGCVRLRTSEPVYFNKDKDKNYVDDNAVKFIVFTLQPNDAEAEGGVTYGAVSQYHYLILAYNNNTRKCIDIYMKDKQLIHNNETLSSEFKIICGAPAFAGTGGLVRDAQVFDYIGIPFECIKDGDEVTGINFTEKFEYDDPAWGDDDTGKDNAGKLQNLLNIIDFNNFKSQSGACVTTEDEDKTHLNGSNMFEKLQNWLKYILDYDNSYQQIFGKTIPWKILASPYMKLYFTDGRGTTGTFDLMKFSHFKNETINLQRFSAISENGKQVYVLNNYNRSDTGEAGNLKVYENAMMIDNSPRDIPFVVDSYTMYLNANKNQLQNTRANAKMTMQLTKEGNAMQLGQTKRGVNTSNEILTNTMNAQSDQLGMQNKFSTQNAGLSAINSTLSGAISGAMFGGVGALAGGLTGAGSGLLGMYQTNREVDLNNNINASQQGMMRANQNAQNNLTMTNARENYAYANKIATNNYEMTLRSQNAMLQDVANHDDVVVSQGTSQMWEASNDLTQMSWQLFTCQESVLLNAVLWFQLFGYSINRYDKVDNYLNRRTVFNYVKTTNANVYASANQSIITAFNNVLNNGVTVWSPDHLDDFRERIIINNDWA